MAKMSRGTPASYFSYFYSKIVYNQQFLELLTSLFHSLGIGGVDDVYEGVGVGKVIAPVLSQGFLSSDVPYVKLKLFVGQVLDVEPLSRSDCADVL